MKQHLPAASGTSRPTAPGRSRGPPPKNSRSSCRLQVDPWPKVNFWYRVGRGQKLPKVTEIFCFNRIKIERRWGRAPGVRGYRAGGAARRGPGAPRATFQSTSGAPSARSRVCTAHARRSRAHFPAARPPNASPAARPHGSGARGLRGPHSAARLGARL